jgi:hypothetical protein
MSFHVGTPRAGPALGGIWRDLAGSGGIWRDLAAGLLRPMGLGVLACTAVTVVDSMGERSGYSCWWTAPIESSARRSVAS